MNIPQHDPVLAALDELAGAADGHFVADRMAGVTGKARARRHRRRAAVAGTFAVVVTMATAVAQLMPGDAPATPVTTPVTAPSEESEGTGTTLVIRPVTAHQVAPRTVEVEFAIHGVSGEYVDEGGRTGDSGPAGISAFLDGEPVYQAEGGDGWCEAGAAQLRYHDTWGFRARVPGPGTYDVTIHSTYCGLDGERVPIETTESVTVVEPGGVTVTAPEDPPAASTEGLAIVQVEVTRVAPTRIAVEFRLHGRSGEWVNVNGPMGSGGPSGFGIRLDGKPRSGADGGASWCEAGPRQLPYDEVLSTSTHVPGPGTYELTVEADYCAANGKTVPVEVTRTVTIH